MTTKRKGRTSATPKTSVKRNRIKIVLRIKALIIGAACWGILPIKLADWLIQRGGLHDA